MIKKITNKGFFKWLFTNVNYYIIAFVLAFLSLFISESNTYLDLTIDFLIYFVIYGILLILPFALIKSVLRIKDDEEFKVKSFGGWLIYIWGCVWLDFLLFWILHLILRDKEDRFFGVSFHNLIYNFGLYTIPILVIIIILNIF